MCQVAAVCQHLASIPQLGQGYNAVGFSQGGQFLRAVLERCQHKEGMPHMSKLITLGGQHQGVMAGPECSGLSFNQTPSTACKVVQRLLGFGAYLPWIRSHIIQAQYFKVITYSPLQSGLEPGLLLSSGRSVCLMWLLRCCSNGICEPFHMT